MPLTPATRLGPYEILSPLGSGGMGEVYRARDPRLKRDIAIKVLPVDVASSSARLARFEREASTVAGLNHPNIVTLYSIEETGGIRFLTMELVEGRDLSNLVVPGGLGLVQVLDLAIPLAEALVAAHEKGVVHRDLKPANVMVTREGRVKVLDFGLARHASAGATDATMTSPVSEAGQAIGTPAYMAPEQIRGEPVDARTDLFAFGVLVYELAVGRRPFDGRTSMDVGSAILRDRPPSLRSVRPELPADLERILSRCLEKHPRERFQTALDLLNELRQLRRELELGASTAAPKPAADALASIAVLPFVNRSASADDEYFSDGLADELLGVLAKIRGLRVAARTSAFHFKGRDTTIAEIGQALNVATVLEGSVRKAGTRVRISVQLVKVSDGYHLWSETYDRTLEDIFAVQDDIAQSVVRELRTTLLGEEADSQASSEARAEVFQATRGRTTDPEAHRLYLLSQFLIDRYNREDHALAIAYLKQALERDPEFALAWASLSGAYADQAGFVWAPTEQTFEHAREAARKSLALEPDLAEGHSILGLVQMTHDWDWQAAQASVARSLELAPGSAQVLRRAAMLAGFLGRLEESIAVLRRAQALDPMTSSVHTRLGLALFGAGRFTEAEEAFRQTLELAPNRTGSRSFLALALLVQGRGAEGLAEAMREPEVEMRLWSLALAHHFLGDRDKSDEALRQLIESHVDTMAYQIAQVYAARGETDAAFEWLERAYSQPDPGVVQVRMSHFLRSLHGDPRWAALMKKMGFEK